jgi:hypothetical protein
MKCFRCLKKIENKDNYFAMAEYSNGIKVRVDYVHKNCWNNFINRMDSVGQTLKKSNLLLDALGNQMNKMGMIPDKEVVIC